MEPTTDEPVEEPEPEPTEEPEPEPEELPELRVGETIQTVEPGRPGQWEGTLIVEEAGVVVLEAVAHSRGAHSELTVTAPDGEVIAEEAGSGPELSRFSDATQTDPLVMRTMEPGEYHVHVRGFNIEHSDEFEDGGELRAWVPDQVEIGSSTEIVFDEYDSFGDTWKGWVSIPEQGQYTFTAARTDDQTQPVLNVTHVQEGLEPHPDLPDLYYLYDVHVDGVAQVQEVIPAGDYVVMVAEGMGLEGTATFTIEGP